MFTKKTSDNQVTTSETDIANEVLRQLSEKQIAPTPEAFERAYNELIGVAEKGTPELVLTSMAEKIQKENPAFGRRLNKALLERDWVLFETNVSAYLQEKATAAGTTETTKTPMLNSARREDMMRSMLLHLLSVIVPEYLEDGSLSNEEAENIGQEVKRCRSEEDFKAVAEKLNTFCYKVESQGKEAKKRHELLVRLLNMIFMNISQLVDDSSWIKTQMYRINRVLETNISVPALEAATKDLREILYRQGTLRTSIAESRFNINNLLKTFVAQLGVVATSAESYESKISGYSKQISNTEDISVVRKVLEGIRRDTSDFHAETANTKTALQSAQKEARDAEERIRVLESKLEAMTDLAREDDLTGALNRRGLDEIMDKEIQRSLRNGSKMCAAMIDLDDFKKLNDTYGHKVGDDALVHLVSVIKDTVRSVDVVGRLGGEEFVILLPETNLQDAVQIMVRIQKQLSKENFFTSDERVRVTFSAGVAMREDDETQEDLIKRADAALYEAKRQGKNRVVAAEVKTIKTST